MFTQKLAPNGTQLLALCLKPASQWTEDDGRRACNLVANWTGEDHQAFAAFLRERL